MLDFTESELLLLRKVQRSDLPAVQEYRSEFLENGGTMDGCSNLRRFEDMNDWYEWIQKAEHRETCPDGWVPDSQYLCLRRKDNRLIGMVDIRHELNDVCLNLFGGIGYSNRHSERGKGYASVQLELAKALCREMGMEKLLVTCHKDNLPSRKTIQRCGGVLENEVIDPRNGDILLRYWISLTK